MLNKQSATGALEISSKRIIQKTAEATGDLIGNKTADKITKASIGSPQNNLDTIKNEIGNAGFDREIPK